MIYYTLEVQTAYSDRLTVVVHSLRKLFLGAGGQNNYGLIENCKRARYRTRRSSHIVIYLLPLKLVRSPGAPQRRSFSNCVPPKLEQSRRCEGVRQVYLMRKTRREPPFSAATAHPHLQVTYLEPLTSVQIREQLLHVRVTIVGGFELRVCK